MSGRGLSESQIISNLRDRGVPHREILEALSQTKIKAAVEQPEADPSPVFKAPSPMGSGMPQVEGGGTNAEGMQESIMSQESEAQQAQIGQLPSQGVTPEPVSSDYAGGGESWANQNYEEYSAGQYGENNEGYGNDSGAYSPNMSSDIISEISEQVIAEKISEMRKGVEKIIDFKTTMEAKVEGLSDRLKRIEKIMDTLQTSVLRKTGDYMTDVQDIKKELLETQKTFGKLLPEFRKELDKTPKVHHKKDSKK